MTRCSACKADLSVAEFASPRVSGKPYRRCRTCRENDRQRYLRDPEAFKRFGAARRQALGKEGVKAYNQAYWTANKESLTQASREYRARNPERITASNQAYYEANKAKFYEANRRRFLQRPEIVNEFVRRRIAAQRRAFPAWADVEGMQKLYAKAKEKSLRTGEVYQVDHIVPLQSAKVCGLHVVANLAVIHRSENASKGNRWWPDMP